MKNDLNSILDGLKAASTRIAEQHDRLRGGDPAYALKGDTSSRYSGTSQSDGVLRGDGDHSGDVSLARRLTRGLSAMCLRGLGGCGSRGVIDDGTELCPVCHGRGKLGTEGALHLVEWLIRELDPNYRTEAAQPEALARAVAAKEAREEAEQKHQQELAARQAEERKVLTETQAKLDALKGGKPPTLLEQVQQQQIVEHNKPRTSGPTGR